MSVRDLPRCPAAVTQAGLPAANDSVPLLLEGVDAFLPGLLVGEAVTWHGSDVFADRRVGRGLRVLSVSHDPPWENNEGERPGRTEKSVPTPDAHAVLVEAVPVRYQVKPGMGRKSLRRHRDSRVAAVELRGTSSTRWSRAARSDAL